MAVNLTAVFRLVDEISSKLDAISNSGNTMANTLQTAGSAANGAFGTVASGGARAAQSVDGVAQSASSFSGTIGGAASSADGLTRSIDEVNGSNSELDQTAMEAASSIDGAAQSADYWTDAIGNYDKGAMEAIYSTEELVEAGFKTEDALIAERNAAEKAADAMDELGDESEQAGKQGSSAGEQGKDAVETLQNALVAAGIAKLLKEIADGFIDTVEASIEFESAVTGVYKTVDGTAEQLAAISDETKLLSTVMPATTTDIAAVAEAAGQLGIATDDIMNFTEVMINLGEATNLTSDEAASSLAKFANVTGMAAENYENLGSTIVALGNNFATTEADITAMATRMASAGTLAGLTEPEILALAASLSSVGVEADAGGSSMSTMLTKMQLAVETGSEQLDQFAYVAGMSSEEFQQAWGESAVDALYAFIAGLNDTERTGQTATVLLDEMGITEIRLSNAIKALAGNSDGLARAVDTANGAWVENSALAKEAETRYSTLESKMAMAKNASNNLSIAFGDGLAPAVEKVTEKYTKAVSGITDFVASHPAVVAVITGVAVALGTAAIAVGGYVFVTKLAIPAITAFNVALTANPIGAVIMGVAALTAGVAALVAVLAASENPQEHWTASTRLQYEELDNLNAQYEEACNVYGETSDEARYLAWEIDELTGSIDANKQTFDDYIESLDSTRESIDEMLDSNREAYQEIGDNEGTTLALIAKLEELAAQTEQTVETQEQMKAIIGELNEELPGLSLNYEDVIGNVDGFRAAIESTVKAQAAAERYDAAQQNMVDALNAQYAAQEALSSIEEERALAQAEYEAEYANYLAARESHLNWVGMGGRGNDPYEAEMNRAKAAYKSAEDELEELDTQVQKHNDTITQATEDYDMYLNAVVGYVESTADAEDATKSYEEAVSEAIASVQEDMDALIEAYDAAFEAARTNLDGTVGLFEKVEEKAGVSSDAVIEAWQSQIDSFNDYKANLESLENLGIDPGLLKELSDGSAESISQVAALVDELAGLDSTAAAETVDTINEKFNELETAKNEAAATMAAIQTDFDTKLGELESSMVTAVNNMNMDTEAASAARDTMSAYIQAIRDKQSEAVSAADAVAAAVTAALSRTYAPTISGGGSVSFRGHASGTTDAPDDVFVAGEEGPELIVGGKGSTVFPADETNRIINAIDGTDTRVAEQIENPADKAEAYAVPLDNSDGSVESIDIEKPSRSITRVPDAMVGAGDSNAAIGKDMSPQEKRIMLEIAGKGQIEIDQNVDKDTVVEILYEYLKPVLSDILKQEMYEEGERSYVY